MATDRDVTSEKSRVSHVSLDGYDVCYVGIHTDQIATNVRCYDTRQGVSNNTCQLGTITDEKRCYDITQSINLSTDSYVTPEESCVSHVSLHGYDVRNVGVSSDQIATNIRRHNRWQSRRNSRQQRTVSYEIIRRYITNDIHLTGHRDIPRCRYVSYDVNVCDCW